MFKNISELKSFIQWARGQKLKRIKIADIEIEVSELAFLDEGAVPQSQTLFNEAADEAEPTLGTSPAEKKEEDDLLFWSAR